MALTFLDGQAINDRLRTGADKGIPELRELNGVFLQQMVPDGPAVRYIINDYH